MPHILLVDDEAALLKGLKFSLEREGFTVLMADNGRQALEMAATERPDLIVLDLMLPEIDGLEVCRTIRQTSTVPIIMLTARSEDIDKILGLEMGADDYLTKPFNSRELIARIRAHLRRVNWSCVVPEEERIAFGVLSIDVPKRRVEVSGQGVELTAKEFDILVT
ncbi:MAG: response regulator transcription factor, partial [Bacillota bacterium]|nr:response regulator transcription factor [Bacillota bacterium]